jgi:hypothetical protein
VYVEIASGGGGTWGTITGTLSNQTDLQNALNAKQNSLTFDSTPTNGSTNPVTSDGVFDALALKQDTLTNPVTGTGTSGQVSYWSGTNTQAGSNNLFWDAANNRLSVGTNASIAAMLGIRGSGTTSATTALLVQNSTPTELFKITDDGAATLNGDFLFTKNSQVNFGTFSNQSISIKTNNIERLFIRNDGGINIRFGGFSFGSDNNIAIFRSNGGTTTVASGSSITFGIAVSDSFAAPKFLFNCYNESKNPTSGESSFLQLQQLLFNPSSGSASFSIINAFSTINQTGGANGITRGLYVNPTLTAAADWRGIESVAASNANHTLLKLRNETVDVFTVKADSKIGFFNATPVVQATTGITESAFVENSGGTAINVDSTFDGYTVQQVVKALKDIGILG